MGLEKETIKEQNQGFERVGRPFKISEGSERERRQATIRLYERRAKAIRERHDSPEDPETERMLRVINLIVEDEFRRLGLIDTVGRTTYTPLRIEEVQAVPKVVHGDAGDMVYDDVLDIIQYEDRQNTVRKFVGLLHEGLHTTAAVEFTPMWKSYGASSPEPVIVRSGYMTGEAYRGGSPSYWKWCNEAVVHSKTLDLVRRNLPLLMREFEGTTQDEWLNQDVDMYKGSRRLLDIVLTRMAETSAVNPEDVREEFFRRHVTGDMNHLDELDSAFGPDAKNKLERVRYEDLDKDFQSAVKKALPAY